MPGISERLAAAYRKLGITFHANATPVGKGFCSGRNECNAHATLDNQATAGGISDQRLEEATQTMVRWAKSAGCNMLE